MAATSNIALYIYSALGKGTRVCGQMRSPTVMCLPYLSLSTPLVISNDDLFSLARVPELKLGMAQLLLLLLVSTWFLRMI